MSAKRRPNHRPGDGLSAQEVKFCELFARGSESSTQAYIDAGFPCKQLPTGEPDRENTRQRAWDLFRKPDIGRQIRKFRRRAAAAVEVNTDMVAESLKHEAFTPRRSIFDPKTGRVLPPSKWPPEMDHFIAGFDVKETTKLARDKNGKVKLDRRNRPERETVVEYKIRFNVSTEAKRLLAQWLGMIGDKIAVEERGKATIMTVLLDPTPTVQYNVPFPDDDTPEEDDTAFGNALPEREPAEGAA